MPEYRTFSCQLNPEIYEALKKLAEDNCPPGYKPSMTAEVSRLILKASR